MEIKFCSTLKVERQADAAEFEKRLQALSVPYTWEVPISWAGPYIRITGHVRKTAYLNPT